MRNRSFSFFSEKMSGLYFNLQNLAKKYNNLDFTNYSSKLNPVPYDFNPISFLTTAQPTIDLYGLDDLYPRIREAIFHKNIQVKFTNLKKSSREGFTIFFGKKFELF